MTVYRYPCERIYAACRPVANGTSYSHWKIPLHQLAVVVVVSDLWPLPGRPPAFPVRRRYANGWADYCAWATQFVASNRASCAMRCAEKRANCGTAASASFGGRRSWRPVGRATVTWRNSPTCIRTPCGVAAASAPAPAFQERWPEPWYRYYSHSNIPTFCVSACPCKYRNCSSSRAS